MDTEALAVALTSKLDLKELEVLERRENEVF